VSPRYFVDDCTVEALARLLCHHGGRLAQFGAEGTAFEIASGRYSDSDCFDIYLKAHDGDVFRSDRITRESLSCDCPCLTAGLMVQPEVIRGIHSPRAKGLGFLARWLYAFPSPKVGARDIRPDPIPENVLFDYHNILTAFWAMPTPSGPVTIAFNQEADDLLAAFERVIEPRIGPDGDMAHLAAWGTKLSGEVARLAGTLHMAAAAEINKITDPGPVPASAVAAAVRLADQFLIPHAFAAFAAMQADPAENLARRVLRHLSRHPEKSVSSKRDIYQALKGSDTQLRADDLDGPLKLLGDHGYIRAIEANRNSSRSERYEVNPLWNRSSEDPRA